jgi:hypothetical protein
MVSCVNGRFAKAALGSQVLPGVIAAEFKRQLVTYGPILRELSRTDFAAAVPALAAVLQE